MKARELGEELPHQRKDSPLQKPEMAMANPPPPKEVLVAEMRYK